MAHTSTMIDIQLWTPNVPSDRGQTCQDLLDGARMPGIRCDLRWLAVLRDAFRYDTYVLEATNDGRTVGLLPLVLIKSKLFGRFLASLPLVSCAGVVAEDDAVAVALVDRAVELADALNVRYLELRHRVEVNHPALNSQMTGKVDMPLALSPSSDVVWKGLRDTVRRQIRKARKGKLSVRWGREELLDDFYGVFSHNMRDLGTPVYGRRFFESILEQFEQEAEFCVVRLQAKAIAALLVLHGRQSTEVPFASSLVAHRSTAANSLMHWHAIERAMERGQTAFDFGRSTIDGGTYEFKKKWGAAPSPLVWQYYVREGNATDMRPDNGKYDRFKRVWRRLPVGLTRMIGPPIVRGIPA